MRTNRDAVRWAITIDQWNGTCIARDRRLAHNVAKDRVMVRTPLHISGYDS